MERTHAQTAGSSSDHQVAPHVGPHFEDSRAALCSGPRRPPVTVESLLSRPFSQRSSVEKMDILARGRPTPDIDLPDFDSNLYISKPWLTVCPKAIKLFCWPCLLFSAKSSIWTTGFGDLENLQRDALEHERSVQHISSQVQLCIYGHARHTRQEPGAKRARLTMDEPECDAMMSEASGPKQQPPKDQFRNPEEFRCFILKSLSRLIMPILCGSHNSLVDEDVEVYEDDEDDFDDSPTPCFQTLVGLLELQFEAMSQSRDRLLSHLTGNRLKDAIKSALSSLNPYSLLSSLTIRHQNNLVESVGEAFLEEIKKEIRGSSFVSLILHETPIHSFTDPELATIARYVTKDGFAVERFVGYTPVKIDTADGLTERVFTFLQKLDCGDKMVALSYGTQAVSSSHISGHVAQVKERYPWVNSVHWYVSETSTALATAYGVTETSKDEADELWVREGFFPYLNNLDVFFTNSYYCDERVRVLKEIISKRSPSSSAPLRWNKKSDLVKTVKEHRESLMELSTMFGCWPEPFDRDIEDSEWKFADLDDPQFMFLLEVFSAIFCCTDKFVNSLKGMVLKTGSGAKALKRTLEALNAMHGDFDAIFSKGLKQADNPTQAGKWEEESRDAFRELYVRALDTITSELAMRFESLAKMTFTELLNVSRFRVYRGAFPEEAFSCLQDGYGRFFDLVLLRNELEVVYASPDLKKKNLDEFVAGLHTTGLAAILPQVSKLCELIQVLPLGSTKTQRGFGAISRRIQIYANQVTLCGDEDGRRKKGRVPALALMAIERKMLRQISKSEGFDERVVRLFDQKEPRIDM